ncbi:MAG: hypothetical protein ACTSSN_07590 [Candidatus Heimdallarchaeaceae archaeon]
MAKKKILSVSILMIGLLTISFLSTMKTNASSDYGVNEITHSPVPLQQGQNLTVQIVFYNDTDVDIVKLLICTISPNFVCEPQPIIMNEITTLTYTANFLIEYEDGTEVGYHIQIVYLNTSSVIIPDTVDYLSMDNIIEPVTDEIFFSAGIVGDISKTGCCGILGTILAIVSSTIIIKRNKKVN